MSSISKYWSIVWLGSVLLACSPTTQPTTSTGSYDEDLSGLRPQVGSTQVMPDPVEEVEQEEIPYVEPTNHLRAEIDSVIRIKSARNQEAGFLPGFTIQVYSGRSREAANNAKYVVNTLLENEEPQVYYDQPRFRVKVGQYYSRLEAEKNLNLLKGEFRQALILQERIPLDQ